MKFKPGQSGNPGGRPLRAQAEVARLARLYTEDALSTLAEICKDAAAQPSARVSAAVALLDRGYGKAPVEVTITNDESDPTGLSDRDLDAALASEIATYLETIGSGKSAAEYSGEVH